MDEYITTLEAPRVNSLLKEEVRQTYRKRWDGFSNPLHCAGFDLDPEFQNIPKNAEVMRGLRKVCKEVLG